MSVADLIERYSKSCDTPDCRSEQAGWVSSHDVLQIRKGGQLVPYMLRMHRSKSMVYATPSGPCPVRVVYDSFGLKISIPMHAVKCQFGLARLKDKDLVAPDHVVRYAPGQKFE